MPHGLTHQAPPSPRWASAACGRCLACRRDQRCTSGHRAVACVRRSVPPLLDATGHSPAALRGWYDRAAPLQFRYSGRREAAGLAVATPSCQCGRCLTHSLDPSDSSRQFRSEQSAVGRFVHPSTHGRDPDVDGYGFQDEETPSGIRAFILRHSAARDGREQVAQATGRPVGGSPTVAANPLIRLILWSTGRWSCPPGSLVSVRDPSPRHDHLAHSGPVEIADSEGKDFRQPRKNCASVSGRR